jgi:hypothetical protein
MVAALVAAPLVKLAEGSTWRLETLPSLKLRPDSVRRRNPSRCTDCLHNIPHYRAPMLRVAFLIEGAITQRQHVPVEPRGLALRRGMT